MTACPTLVIMVKLPRPGLAKTRLGREIGAGSAARWYRHQTMRLIRRLRAPRRWDLLLAVDPGGAAASPVWPADVPRMAQPRTDLGERMLTALRAPGGPALVVGSDVPGLDAESVAAAFRALRRADAALCPAPDGGFWGIGLRRPAALSPRRLAGIAWSTDRAMADTAARLAPLRVAFGPTLADVDTAADLPDATAWRRG